MSSLPLILRLNRDARKTISSRQLDVQTTEDPLPAEVEIVDGDGDHRQPGTLFSRVQRETTDDE